MPDAAFPTGRLEHRGSIPEEIRPLVGTRLYGCDTCVTVCPWNGKPLPEADERFRMSRLLASIPLRDLLALDAGGFADLFRNSPLKRIKREGLLRNGCIVLGNAGAPDDIDFLKALSGESPLVAEHASWAVERILRRHGGMHVQAAQEIKNRKNDVLLLSKPQFMVSILPQAIALLRGREK